MCGVVTVIFLYKFIIVTSCIYGDAIGASLCEALGEALGAALGLDVSSSSRRRRPAPSSGEALGLVLGAALGLLGLAPGFFMIVGDLVGHGVGDVVGDVLGTTLGDSDGDLLGTTLGLTLGMKVLGLADGLRVHPHPPLIALNSDNS